MNSPFAALVLLSELISVEVYHVSHLRRIQPMLWLFLALLSLGGCRSGIPEAELSEMHEVQRGWMQIMQKAESQYVSMATRHNDFMLAVQDTSNHWRQAAIKQDTALQLRIDRLQTSFDGASRRRLFQLKELQGFLDANEVWLMRIEVEGSPRRAILNSWEARRTQFGSMLGALDASHGDLDALQPEYDKISRLIPGMSTAEAITPAAAPVSQPIPNPQPVAAPQPAPGAVAPQGV